jgi:hypothetical protein
METKPLGESWKDEAEELDWGNPQRLASLQRLVIELLIKNQRLRMELIARRVELDADIHDAITNDACSAMEGLCLLKTEMQAVFTTSD